MYDIPLCNSCFYLFDCLTFRWEHSTENRRQAKIPEKPCESSEMIHANVLALQGKYRLLKSIRSVKFIPLLKFPLFVKFYEFTSFLTGKP